MHLNIVPKLWLFFIFSAAISRKQKKWVICDDILMTSYNSGSEHNN